MNLDNDKDYFLHDFESEKRGDTAADPDRTPEAGEKVDFTATAGGDTGGETQAARRGGCRRFWGWFFTILALILAATFYIRYLTPHTTDSRMTGYITLVERRGIICKTFEGEMISLAALADSTVYRQKVTFSIPSDSLALALQKYQGTGRPVSVTFEKYYGTLPWRGASATVAVAAEPAE